jgi:hypothetical protein
MVRRFLVPAILLLILAIPACKSDRKTDSKGATPLPPDQGVKPGAGRAG